MATDHSIPLSTAAGMTSSYRTNKEALLVTAKQGLNILPICETFDRAAFDTLLAPTDCKSIRIYFGMDSDLKIHCVIVGVNADDEDMLPNDSNDYQIMDGGVRCPENCPPSSDLNS